MADDLEFTISAQGIKPTSPGAVDAIHFHTTDIGTVLDGPKLAPMKLDISTKKAGDPETPQLGDPFRLEATFWAKSPFDQAHLPGKVSPVRLSMSVKLHGVVVSLGLNEMVLKMVPSMPAEGLIASADDPLQFFLDERVAFFQNFELAAAARFRVRRDSTPPVPIGRIHASFDPLHLVLRFPSAFRSFPGNEQFPLEAPNKIFVTELTIQGGTLVDSRDKPVAGDAPFRRSMRFPVDDARLRMFLEDRAHKDKLSGPPVPTAPIPKGPFGPGSLGPQFPKKP